MVGGLHCVTSIMKGTMIVFTGVDSCSAYRFVLTTGNYTNRMPYPPAWYSTQRYSDQETHFWANEIWKWTQSQGIHWSYQVPRHPEAVSLIKWWNCLFDKGWLVGNTLLARWPYLAGLGQDYPEVYVRCESNILCSFSPYVGLTDPKKWFHSRCRNQSATTNYYS